MDANGDTQHPTAPDIELCKFIETTNLADMFYIKFKESPQTYMWGTTQLDYILIDPGLIPAVESIGYLGTHKGFNTNHVYAFMDLNDKISHQGIVHCQITTKSREFTLTQSDKVKAFLDNLVKASRTNTYKEWVNKLAQLFKEHGQTPDNIRI